MATPSDAVELTAVRWAASGTRHAAFGLEARTLVKVSEAEVAGSMHA